MPQLSRSSRSFAKAIRHETRYSIGAKPTVRWKRSWKAGASLLGARAVLASSFERIHRSNLVNMGILPLPLPADRHPSALALRPGDRLQVDAPADRMRPRMDVPVAILRADGAIERFTARAAVETSLDVEVLMAGGVIPLILQREMQVATTAKDLAVSAA